MFHNIGPHDLVIQTTDLMGLTLDMGASQNFRLEKPIIESMSGDGQTANSNSMVQ